MRILFSTRLTEPSTTASTLSSRDISGQLFLVRLRCGIEVREATRSDRIFDRLAINSSVITSTKYSCPASPERFSRGKTARDLIGCPFVLQNLRLSRPLL